MKKLLITCLAVVATLAAGAQTMKIQVGQVTYLVPASQAGYMPYTDATTLTVMDKVFALSDITKITVDDTEVTDNAVGIVYNGSTATVTVPAKLMNYLAISVSGADVSITQTADLTNDLITAGTVSEPVYTLSGTTTNGSFYMDGESKATFVLNNLSLTNPSGAAIHIADGKRIGLTLSGTSSLVDGSGGSQKGCVWIKGHTEIDGSGTLNITGKSSHAFWGKEYLQIKKNAGTINILGAVGDGINVNQYYQQNGGTVTIKNVGDDGIAVAYKTDDSDVIIPLSTDEDNTGAVLIQGGTLSATITAAGAKGIKCEGAMTINDSKSTPVITITNSGGVATSTSGSTTDYTSSSCLKSDEAITIAAGTLTLTNSGQGGRAINCEKTVDISGGSITAKSTGSNLENSSSSSGGGGRPGGGGWGPGGGGPGGDSKNLKSAKGVKAKGNMTISGGTIVATSANHEAIETKGTLTVTGGDVYAYAKDDAINSASHMYLKGGFVCGHSSGNDGIDANGNLYVQGATVYAIGTTSPEMALDANTEGGYKLYLQSGTVIAIGSLESGYSSSLTVKQATSWTKNAWYTLYNNGTEVVSFKTPSSGPSQLVVATSSTPTLKSGTTVSGGTSLWNSTGNSGGTVSGGSSVTLSTYSNSGGGWW